MRIANTDCELVLRPQLGGAIESFTWRGQDILRSANSSEDNIVEMACFPMVPVVNRIPNGAFGFEGRNVQLDANLPETTDFIHGFGWKLPWTIKAQSDSDITLELLCPAEDWPWSFVASQDFMLKENGLTVRLDIMNTSDSPMPAALGLHLYFPTTAQTRLRAHYDGHWESNAMQHAPRKVLGSTRKDFTRGADLTDTHFLDTTHYGWRGPAVISEAGRPDIRITASKNAGKPACLLSSRGRVCCHRAGNCAQQYVRRWAGGI